MPHLRFDQTTSDWVVFAPLRKLRPGRETDKSPPKTDSDTSTAAHCPFCPGNEDLTPPEIYAIRDRTSAGVSEWRVRVVPNKFPALMIEENLRRLEEGALFHQMGGCGAHEVVIESPDHATGLDQQPVGQIELVLKAVQDRYRDLMRDRRFQSIVIFKNHGLAAGTSLRHPHWQIIATPIVPRMLRLKFIEATEYFDRTGKCLYSVMVGQELEAETRMVTANDDYVAFVPYAAHVPFETWIVPRVQQAAFDSVTRQQLRSLAEILKTVLLRHNVGLDNPDYNLTIDMAARGDEDKEYFMWHIRIIPRLSTPAGFELGSGMSINTVLPEDAAAFLR